MDRCTKERSLLRAFIASGALSLAVFPAYAESVLPSNWETNVFVQAGASDTLVGPWRMSSASDGVAKTGGGTWTLPVGSVWTRGDLDMDVHGGTLELSSGGSIPAATPDMPPAVLANAAIWLEAGTNTAPWAEDAGRVNYWYDVRETKDASDNWSANWFRMYARPGKDVNSNTVTNYPVLEQVETVSGTRPMMYFHGASSGSWMEYRNAGGTATQRDKIRHVFVAINIAATYGFVLGVQGGSVPFLHPQQIDGTLTGGYASPPSGSPAFAFSRFYLNGESAEPDVVVTKKGLQVIEVECDDMAYGSVGTLFNDRAIAKRYGGDHVGELVIFTNRLTEAQRLEVGEYLLRKWVGEPKSPAVSVRLAEGTSARKGSTPAMIGGAGSLWLDGGGAWLQTGGYPFFGTVRLTAGAGAGLAEVGELPYDLVAGDVVAAPVDQHAAATVTRTTDATAAANGTATYTGAQPLRVGSLAGVKSAAIETDELILGKKPKPSDVLSTNVYATIADGNADFEKYRTAGSYPSASSNGSTTRDGWTLKSLTTTRPDNGNSIVGSVTTFNGASAINSAPSGNSWYLGFNETANINSYQLMPFYPPKGNAIVFMKVAGEISADVQVPEAGDYEFSYHGIARIGYDFGDITLSLVNETVSPAVTNTFARYLQPAGNGWRKYRFLLRNVEAGTYRLHVRMIGVRPNADCHAGFDDFEMRLVSPAGSGMTTAEPPNASFEVAQCPFDYRSSYTWRVTAPGWTLVQGQVGTDTISTNGPARNCEACFAQRPQGGWFDPVGRYGQTQLHLRGSGGYAQTDPFTLPAGTWRLHYRGARWTFTDNGTYKWNNINPYNGAKLSASVFVNGTETPLGTSELPLRRRLLVDRALPTTFTVTASDSVVLRLWQSAPNASTGMSDLTVDGVYFERMSSDRAGDELVKDGSFEEGGVWTLKRNNDGHPNSSDDRYYSQCGISRNGDKNYGYTTCDGTCALLIVQIGQATQPITFAEPGLYKLSFWTRSRYYTPSTAPGTINSTYYGGNQVKVWLADGEGATNEIFRTTSVYSTNYLEHVALFRVDDPGTFTLGIQGCNDYPGHVTTSSSNKRDANVFVDLVSIRRTDEDLTPTLDRDLQLALGGNGRLRLDYAGTNTIKRLRLGGQSVCGVIDASHESGRVFGPGALYVPPSGTMVIFR